MQNTTALLLLDRNTPDQTISDYAEACAAANIHLSCMVIGLAPEMPTSAYGVPPYGMIDFPADWAEQIETERTRENTRLQEVEQLLARSGISGDVLSAFCAQSDVKHYVARKARVSDIAYVASNLRDVSVFQEAASGVLFGSPIGLIVNAVAPAAPRTVFIAWDSSNAAARAVHVALAMLKSAKEVVVGCFDPVTMTSADGSNPGSDLAAWLSHHGCTVTVTQYPSGGNEIGQCIQERAREVGADLVVMGAYGHSRLLQAVFGGTSRSMMEQTEIPVLFAH